MISIRNKGTVKNNNWQRLQVLQEWGYLKSYFIEVWLRWNVNPFIISKAVNSYKLEFYGWRNRRKHVTCQHHMSHVTCHNMSHVNIKKVSVAHTTVLLFLSRWSYRFQTFLMLSLLFQDYVSPLLLKDGEKRICQYVLTLRTLFCACVGNCHVRLFINIQVVLYTCKLLLVILEAICCVYLVCKQLFA